MWSRPEILPNTVFTDHALDRARERFCPGASKRQVLDWLASRGARARLVGFDPINNFRWYVPGDPPMVWITDVCEKGWKVVTLYPPNPDDMKIWPSFIHFGAYARMANADVRAVQEMAEQMDVMSREMKEIDDERCELRGFLTRLAEGGHLASVPRALRVDLLLALGIEVEEQAA